MENDGVTLSRFLYIDLDAHSRSILEEMSQKYIDLCNAYMKHIKSTHYQYLRSKGYQLRDRLVPLYNDHPYSMTKDYNRFAFESVEATLKQHQNKIIKRVIKAIFNRDLTQRERDHIAQRFYEKGLSHFINTPAHQLDLIGRCVNIS